MHFLDKNNPDKLTQTGYETNPVGRIGPIFQPREYLVSDHT